jgi:ABC-type multidrug transport system ATPase subunit
VPADGGATVVVSELRASIGRRRVLDGVAFEATGGLVCLAGANGAGKSTLLRVLCGLQPFAGTARVGPADLATRRGRRAAHALVGYLPQESEVWVDLTVAESVLYTGWLHRLADLEGAAVRALESVGLVDRAGERAGSLSVGMRRRLALAQAIVHDPPVLLLDEPTAGVDVAHRARFRDLLRGLGEDRTVLFASHLTEELEHLADRILVVDAGRLCFDGTAAALGEGAQPAAGEHPLEAALRRLGSAAG